MQLSEIDQIPYKFASNHQHEAFDFTILMEIQSIEEQKKFNVRKHKQQ